MDRWDELNQEERRLADQLEDKENYRRKLEKVYADLEWYDQDSYWSETNAYEAAYQSRFAGELEWQTERLRHLKSQSFEDFTDYIDSLKKEEHAIEDEMDKIYYEKQKESLKEEEKRYGN